MQELLFDFANPLDERFGRDFFSDLPKTPGVYKMYDDQGDLIYVGKAKNLKLRLQSYRRVKIGNPSSKLLRLVHTIGNISFETLESEEKALVRENELLRTTKPPFNVVNKAPEKYFYFKVNVLSDSLAVTESGEKISAELSLTMNPTGDGQHFGAFKSMALCQKTFFALRRMLWLVNEPESTFSKDFAFPYHLSRKQRVHIHPFVIDRFWLNELSGFLYGFSPAFKQAPPLIRPLQDVVAQLTECDLFHRNWFQSEIELLQKFYRSSSAKNLRLKKNMNYDSPVILQQTLDDLICTERFRLV